MSSKNYLWIQRGSDLSWHGWGRPFRRYGTWAGRLGVEKGISGEGSGTRKGTELWHTWHPRKMTVLWLTTFGTQGTTDKVGEEQQALEREGPWTPCCRARTASQAKGFHAGEWWDWMSVLERYLLQGCEGRTKEANWWLSSSCESETERWVVTSG